MAACHRLGGRACGRRKQQSRNGDRCKSIQAAHIPDDRPSGTSFHPHLMSPDHTANPSASAPPLGPCLRRSLTNGWKFAALIACSDGQDERLSAALSRPQAQLCLRLRQRGITSVLATRLTRTLRVSDAPASYGCNRFVDSHREKPQGGQSVSVPTISSTHAERRWARRLAPLPTLRIPRNDDLHPRHAQIARRAHFLLRRRANHNHASARPAAT